jgi:glutamine---fructose-6-phosphate transaminase (isomerizing)
MCGIVGYSGHNDGVPVILEGLRRLEYRGYDSSGIAFLENDKIKIIKKEGKLQNLVNDLSAANPISSLAIGHTRWATHGKVNDLNAHPHGDEDISIVHNGIIENAGELKKILKEQGATFDSETDSEVFYQLLKVELKTTTMSDAILKVFKKVKGNSAFVIVEKCSRKIFSIKKSAPLVCGLNKTTNEVFVSSDPYALVGFAEDIIFPGDNILCIGDVQDGAEFKFYDINAMETLNFKVQSNKTVLELSTKDQFEHYMLKEIHEQPLLVKTLIRKYKEEGFFEIIEKIAKEKVSTFHIVGCGSAWHAGWVIKNFFESICRIRVNLELASEFRYKNPIIHSGEFVLFISQSGETADTIACQEMCREKKVTTYSIVNVDGSTLYRHCNENLLIYAGIEIGVASTKAFTQQMLAGYLLALGFIKNKDINQIEANFLLLADKIQEILDRTSEIQQIAEEVFTKKGFIFTGRGALYPIVLEGALKLKEIAYVHAEGYPSGELKHGPISLIDENILNIALFTDELFEKSLSNAQEVKTRKGIMFVVGEKNNEELSELADYYFGISTKDLGDLQIVALNVVLQLFSYYVAKMKGTDIDKPRNLAKSVTVE